MNNFEIKPTIDPKDKYLKAKKALIEAMNSIRDLNPQQRQQLAYDVFDAQIVSAVLNIMQQNFNRNF